MKRTVVGNVCAAVVAAAGVLLPLNAETIAWWRFNGTGTNVPNVANPGYLDGTIVAVSNDVTSGEAALDQVAFTATPSKYPSITTNLQSVAPNIYDMEVGSAMPGGKTLTYGDEWLQGGVMVPYDDALKFASTSGKFTIQAMIRMPKCAPSRTKREGSTMFPIVCCGKEYEEGWIFGIYEGRLYFRYTFMDSNGEIAHVDGGNTAKYYAHDIPSLYDGKWHHVAVMFNTAGKNGVARLYLDGVQYGEARTYTFGEWTYAGDSPLFIGANPYQCGRTFYGDIAEVRLASGVDNDDFLVPLADGKGFADDDTALLLTFDNTASLGFPTNRVIGTRSSASATSDFRAWYAKNWNVLNAAYNNPLLVTWDPYAAANSPSNTIDALRPQATNDVKDTVMFAVSDSGATTNVALNGCSMKFTPLFLKGSKETIGSDPISVANMHTLVSDAGFTMEFVYKGSIPDTNTVTLVHCAYLRVMIYKGHLLVRWYDTGARSGNKNLDLTSTVVNDGAWHHVAVTWNGSSTITAYLDHLQVGQKTGMSLFADASTTEGACQIGSRDKEAIAGGSAVADPADEWELDMVRFTRRVLTTDEFLDGASPQVDRVHDSRFDGDTTSSVATGLPDYLAPAGVGGANSGASLPSFVASRGGRVVLDGTNGTNAVAWGNALQLNGCNYVHYPRNLLLQQGGAMTIEFFAKIDSLDDTARIFSLRWGDSATATEAFSFQRSGDRFAFGARLSKTDGISVIPDSVQWPNNYVYNWSTHPGTLGKWHHWAFTIDPLSTGKTRITTYVDYSTADVVINSPNGWPYIPPEGVTLTLGDATKNVNATIDNFRITPGILDPSKFMGCTSAGLIISFR
jgi:hypothetical protein